MSGGSGTGTRVIPSGGGITRDAFTLQALADLQVFYDACGETVDIDDTNGAPAYSDVVAIFSFGHGDEYRGSDAPGTDGEVRIRVSDAATISAGYMIYRGTEEWRILGGGNLSEDGLEWVLPISKLS